MFLGKIVAEILSLKMYYFFNKISKIAEPWRWSTQTSAI